MIFKISVGNPIFLNCHRFTFDSGEDSSDEELETDQIPPMQNNESSKCFSFAIAL